MLASPRCSLHYASILMCNQRSSLTHWKWKPLDWRIGANITTRKLFTAVKRREWEREGWRDGVACPGFAFWEKKNKSPHVACGVSGRRSWGPTVFWARVSGPSRPIIFESPEWLPTASCTAAFRILCPLALTRGAALSTVALNITTDTQQHWSNPSQC